MSTQLNFHRLIWTGSLIICLMLMTGCFSFTAAPAAEHQEISSTEAEADVAPVAEEPAPAKEEAVAAEPLATMPATTGSTAPMDLAYDDAAEAAPERAGEAEFSDEAPVVTDIQQATPLQAGEVDDNAQWDDYLLYRRNYTGPAVHPVDISERYIIEVNDGQGQPVLGAKVSVFLGTQAVFSGQTYANGRVLFHPLAANIPAEQADSFQVVVEKDNLSEEFTLARFGAQGNNATERWTVRLDDQIALNELNLDVLFLIDATGSMADEIAKIQSTIFDVAARIDGLPGHPNVRYGMVTYRDRGDAFVTNVFEFTPDVQEFHRDLSTVYADGGGDYPESLNEGLHDALHSVEWRGGNTVQLIFLVADAPPHLDYALDYDYAEEMAIAAERGVKIFPIASSGLDDQGEYIFRQLAQYSQGRFIFLTYEGPTNGGAPGEVTTHHVEDYSVENLDNLLVKLVEEELAYQQSQLLGVGN